MSSVYTPAKPLSFEEYLTYDDGSGRRYDLLDTGELLELPYENDINVILAMALAEYLKQFVNWRFLRLNTLAIEVKPTTVEPSPGRTRRVRQQSRIPDLMVLTAQGAQQIFGRPSGLALHHDNPVLIVEFVSQSNADEDYVDKRSQYEARGVCEYWIADRHQQQVSVLILKAGRYEETVYQGDHMICSAAFPQVQLTAQRLLTVEDLP